jgi:hypothetical protein
MKTHLEALAWVKKLKDYDMKSIGEQTQQNHRKSWNLAFQAQRRS